MRVSLGFRASSAEEPRLKLADVLSFRGFSTLGSVLTHVSRLFCPGGDDRRRLFSPFAWCLVVGRFLVVLCLVGSVGFFSIGAYCLLPACLPLVMAFPLNTRAGFHCFSGSQRLGVSRLSYPVVIWVSRVSYLNPSSQNLKPSAQVFSVFLVGFCRMAPWGFASNNCSVLLMQAYLASSVHVWSRERILMLSTSSCPWSSQSLRADHRGGQNYRIPTLVITLVLLLWQAVVQIS
ncbi:hypothetical protein F2Q70_00010477 [Brassica cretica]|uniref:Uncharacterized protein n=1 Tax=Brassica cretica TaxID=69181 RepID=A0A8S9M4J0_BRACR|nr:hypothetical protein F2Q70_00010477 [Brassica cretica]